MINEVKDAQMGESQNAAAIGDMIAQNSQNKTPLDRLRRDIRGIWKSGDGVFELVLTEYQIRAYNNIGGEKKPRPNISGEYMLIDEKHGRLLFPSGKWTWFGYELDGDRLDIGFANASIGLLHRERDGGEALEGKF